MGLSETSAMLATRGLIIPALLALSACTGDPATSPTVTVVSAARVAAGGPSVKSTVPDSAPPNVTLDVRVMGSGYDVGSRATWALKGDTAFATTKIRTNSTRYVSSRELVANITIAADARQELYDVVVMAAGGKNGVGIELFAVSSNYGSYTVYAASLDDAAPYRLRSDNGTPYIDGGPDFSLGCVFSRTSTGFYQLRTIAADERCKAVQRPGWRWFRLDIGVAMFDFDQDGTAESTEDVAARLLLPDAFAKGRTSTPADLHVMKVNADGSTEWGSVWILKYRTGATMTTDAAGTTVVEATSTPVDVYVCPCPNNGKPVASIQLPFRLSLRR
jgi:hypothetical protein